MEKIIVPLNIIIGLVGFGLIAKWYVIPTLQPYPRNRALLFLISPHIFRYLGLWFLITGVVSAELPSAFSIPSAYGDLLTALLALLALVALQNEWNIALTLVWVFNIFGTLDLLNALRLGLLHIHHAGQLGGMFFVPSLLVPFMLVSHFLIFRLIVKRV